MSHLLPEHQENKRHEVIDNIFFYRYGDHRNLHSFPTRRSSDLRRSPQPSRRAMRYALSASARRAESRSEEHTSELQSQFHLVCRLLLEKQKPVFLSDDDYLNEVIAECDDHTL